MDQSLYQVIWQNQKRYLSGRWYNLHLGQQHGEAKTAVFSLIAVYSSFTLKWKRHHLCFLSPPPPPQMQLPHLGTKFIVTSAWFFNTGWFKSPMPSTVAVEEQVDFYRTQGCVLLCCVQFTGLGIQCQWQIPYCPMLLMCLVGSLDNILLSTHTRAHTHSLSGPLQITNHYN